MDPSVVVVDDEPGVLQLVCDVLEDEGVSVVAIDRPEPALSMAPRLHPEVIILDLMLPGTNGIELARRLRSEGLTATPMVAMSASRGMLHAAQESSLFDDILPKPFDLDRLIGCVDRFLDQRRTA